jgi:serine/threonine protein kinase
LRTPGLRTSLRNSAGALVLPGSAVACPLLPLFVVMRAFAMEPADDDDQSTVTVRAVPAAKPFESGTIDRVSSGGGPGRETIRTSLGKYRLLAELGSGGMATVFLAVMRGQSGFNKLVVVKVLKPHLAVESDVVQMFLNEARLSARLSHPNVVQTNEVGREDGHHMMVMEYLDGVALNQLTERMRARGKTLPLALHLRLIHHALEGLHYAHELADYDGSPLGVVHRDISPHNMFVTFDGQMKLLDFGIAKLAQSTHDTRAGTIKGKIRYMSPEQMRGERVDRRADIFAVGAMLWEAATGEKLWKGKTDVEIMNHVINGEVPSPRTIDPKVNPTLDRICRKALSKNPDDRYPTCVELQNDLEALLNDLSDRTTQKDITRFLAKEFEDVRAERKRIIEDQLTTTSALGSGYFRAITSGEVDIPTLPALPAYGSGSHSIERAAVDEVRPEPLRAPRHAVTVGLLGVALVALLLIFTRTTHVEPTPQPSAPAASAIVAAAPSATAITSASVEAPAPSIEAPAPKVSAPKVIAAPSAAPSPTTMATTTTSVSASVKKPARPIDKANPWTD